MKYLENLILHEFKDINYTFHIEFYKLTEEKLVEEIYQDKEFDKIYISKRNKKLQQQPNEIGNTVLVFINNYSKLINCFEKYKNYIINTSFEEEVYAEDYVFDEDYDFREPIYISIFEQLKMELEDILQKKQYEKGNKGIRKYEIKKDISPLLLVEIYKFENILNQIQTNYFNNLDTKIKLAETEISREIIIAGKTKKEIEIEEGIKEQIKLRKKKLEQQYENLKNGNIIKNACIQFLDNYINDLEEIKKLIDNSFLNKSKKSNTKKFKLNQLYLPLSNFEYNLENENPEIEKYNYTFTNIKELCYITFYQLLLNKKVISKCHCCNDYFIPRERNDEIYCYREYKTKRNEIITCKEKGKYKTYNLKRKNDIDNLYGNLLNRLNGRIKKQDKNYDFYSELKLKLTQAKKKINKKANQTQKYNKYNIIFHRYLTLFDKSYQRKFPKENKNSYSSNQYWYYKKKITSNS